MATIIGTDPTGKVLQILNGDPSAMPATMNGAAMIATILTDAQAAQLEALRATVPPPPTITFINGVFAAGSASVPPVSKPPAPLGVPPAGSLRALLVANNLITAAEAAALTTL